jgi:hypothetical protein
MDEEELIHGEVDRIVVRALMDRDVAVRGKHDSEGGRVRCEGGCQSGKDGVGGENGDIVIGDHEGANVLRRTLRIRAADVLATMPET